MFTRNFNTELQKIFWQCMYLNILQMQMPGKYMYEGLTYMVSQFYINGLFTVGRQLSLVWG